MADESKWEFTPDGVVVGGQEFKLKGEVDGEVLLQYGTRVAADSDVFKVLVAAVGSLSSAEGDRDRLLDRVRKTVTARNDAAAECANLVAIFDQFFEPEGVTAKFQETKLVSQFTREVVEHFSGRKKA